MREHPLTAFLRDPEGWIGWPWEYQEITITNNDQRSPALLLSQATVTAVFTVEIIPYRAVGWEPEGLQREVGSHDIRVRLRRLKTPPEERTGTA